jgi:hypothetical protein
MWLQLTCLVLCCGITGCSTISQWRHRQTLTQIEHIFTACAAKHRRGGLANWVETVQCGNDGVQPLIADSGSPYTELIEAALTSRLTIARQMDEGSLSTDEGQAKLARLNSHMQSLPGSMLELLAMTTAVHPR